jgi:hypothetical protein
MGVKLLHFKIVDGPQGLEFKLPVRDPRAGRCFDLFSSKWALKPTRQINWRESFARKGERYEEYAFVSSQSVKGKIRHVFETGQQIGMKKRVLHLHQSGPSDAILQDEVVTFESHEPVILGLIAGAQSINGDYDEIVGPQGFEWITAHKNLQPFVRWLKAISDDDAPWARSFDQFFIQNWTPGRSFVQVLKTT